MDQLGCLKWVGGGLGLGAWVRASRGSMCGLTPTHHAQPLPPSAVAVVPSPPLWRWQLWGWSREALPPAPTHPTQPVPALLVTVAFPLHPFQTPFFKPPDRWRRWGCRLCCQHSLSLRHPLCKLLFYIEPSRRWQPWGCRLWYLTWRPPALMPPSGRSCWRCTGRLSRKAPRRWVIHGWIALGCVWGYQGQRRADGWFRALHKVTRVSLDKPIGLKRPPCVRLPSHGRAFIWGRNWVRCHPRPSHDHQPQPAQSLNLRCVRFAAGCWALGAARGGSGCSSTCGAAQ